MSRLSIMFGIILFCLIALHGKDTEFKDAIKKKDIQIQRLATEICRALDDAEFKARCIEQRITWSKPL